MDTITKAIAKFKGGVKVPHNKNTAEYESVFMEPPKIVTIPMQQHIGGVCTPTVKKGTLLQLGKLLVTQRLLFQHQSMLLFLAR